MGDGVGVEEEIGGGVDGGEEVGVGEGVGLQDGRWEGHFELVAWVTAILARLPNEERMKTAASQLILRVAV
jgi:hypothetical protein